jgi:hypothetical protein
VDPNPQLLLKGCKTLSNASMARGKKFCFDGHFEQGLEASKHEKLQKPVLHGFGPIPFKLQQLFTLGPNIKFIFGTLEFS